MYNFMHYLYQLMKPSRLWWVTVWAFVAILNPALGQGIVSNHALVSFEHLAVNGTGGYKIHFGGVQSLGNLQLKDLEFERQRIIAGQHTYIAGIGDITFRYDGQPVMDRWVKWQAGTNGFLTLTDPNRSITDNDSIFGLRGVSGVTDFFNQVMNGDLVSEGYLADGSNVALAGKWSTYGTVLAVNGEERGLHTPEGTDGSLVQNSPAVTVSVLRYQHQLQYWDWKQFAIAMNGYVRPIISGGTGTVAGYTDHSGNTLYVTSGRMLTTNPINSTRLTSLAQLSMASHVEAASRNTHRNDGLRVFDLVLFVDHPHGAPTYPGLEVRHFAGDNFFWKGMLYVCGSLDLAFRTRQPPGLLAKSPDHFAVDPTGQTGDYISRCFMDGIVYVTGQIYNGSSKSLYGTLFTYGSSLSSFHAPEIYYNMRLATGMFLNTQFPVKLSLFNAE